MIGTIIATVMVNPVFPSLISCPSIFKMAMTLATAIKTHILAKMIKTTNADSFLTSPVVEAHRILSGCHGAG